jgi:hypothetical protein
MFKSDTQIDIHRVLKKTRFVIARSKATKQSRVSDKKNEIATLPSVARNEPCWVILHPVNNEEKLSFRKMITVNNSSNRIQKDTVYIHYNCPIGPITLRN